MFEEFTNWLEKNKSLIPQGEHFTTKILPSIKSVYVVDANNDGADEYVLAWAEGSKGFLNLLIATSTAQGFGIIAGPPPPHEGTGPGWYGKGFINPVTKEDALFTQLCGRTYISFSGQRLAPSPSSWCWENGKTRPACDPAWVSYSRSLFAKLYEQERYLSAERFLESLLNQCGMRMNDEQRLWVGNDLACAASHVGSETQCLKHIQAVKDDPAYADASEFLWQTTDLDESLCRGVNETVTRDFDWLLDANIANANNAVNDDRFDALLAAVIPEAYKENASLRETVGLNLSGPARAKQIFNEQFVLLEACRSSSCDDKGLLFVDIKGGVGLFAVNDWGPCVSIGSRNVRGEQLPEQFRQSLKLWFKGLKGKCLEFIGPDGRSSPLGLIF